MDRVTPLAVVPELAALRPAVTSAEELLQLLAARARDAGYVSAGFAEALLARERDHPTGLPLPTPAAIPHADAVHVERPALAVALLDPPVTFGEMGSRGRTVDCHLAVMLLVDSPQDQVPVLGRVLAALRRPDWPELLSRATDAGELARRFADLVD